MLRPECGLWPNKMASRVSSCFSNFPLYMCHCLDCQFELRGTENLAGVGDRNRAGPELYLTYSPWHWEWLFFWVASVSTCVGLSLYPWGHCLDFWLLQDSSALCICLIDEGGVKSLLSVKLLGIVIYFAMREYGETHSSELKYFNYLLKYLSCEP